MKSKRLKNLKNIDLPLYYRQMDPSLIKEIRELLTIGKINRLIVEKIRVFSWEKIKKYLI